MDRKNHNKSKLDNSDSSVVESSGQLSIDYKPVRKFYILHGKCNHTTDNYKELESLANKHEKKKKLEDIGAGY